MAVYRVAPQLKMLPVLANRLLPSLSNKLEHFNNEPETPSIKPLAANLNFAVGTVWLGVSKCPRRHYAGICALRLCFLDF